MKEFNLRFFSERRWPDKLDDLLQIAEDELPETSGTYVLGSSDGTNFIYPWGSSPIFYIGQSKNLKKRLLTHKKNISSAIENHDDLYWWPRYQYGASFGTSLAWYSVRGTQNPNKLEADLITSFYDTYGSIPVANGAWPSGLKPKHGTRDDA